jgi:branched-subunit amino acid ABC-type transport system permease component
MKNKIWFNGVLFGISASTLISMVRQDVYGKEAYMKIVEVSWLTGWKNAIVYALVLAFLAVSIIGSFEKEEKP